MQTISNLQKTYSVEDTGNFSVPAPRQIFKRESEP